MGSDKMLDVRDKRHGTEKVPRTLKTSQTGNKSQTRHKEKKVKKTQGQV